MEVTMASNIDTALESSVFLNTLFKDKPNDLWMYLWKERKSTWFRSIEDAASFGSGKDNFYFGCCLSETDNGINRRCTADSAAASPGFWADIDFSDGSQAHKSKSLPFPPDEASALKLIDAVGVKPTMIIHSGHGFQPYWIFESLLIFENDVQRKSFAQRSQAFQERLIELGKGFGWHVDSVGDLARVLRLPGTTNVKPNCEPAPCRLLISDGPRLRNADQLFASIKLQESNGHGVLDFDENPEAGTVIGRPQEHWERIAAGVGAGSRNVDMLSWAGKIAQGMIDVFDQSQVETQWANFQAKNQQNSPPLDIKELKTIWNSALKMEKRKRSDRDVAETVKLVGTNDKGERRWRAEIRMSRPPAYRIYSEHWDGFVQVDAAQLASFAKFDHQVIEQKNFAMPDEYRKLWRKTPKNGESLVAMLLRESVPIEATPEESVDSRLAAAICAALAEAPYRKVDRGLRGAPCRQHEDESILFGFRWLVAEVNFNGTTRILESEVGRMLADVGCDSLKMEWGRYKRLLPASFARLNRLAEST
jgi:hypothetical protein